MATTGKAYEKGRSDAYKECYDLLTKIMNEKKNFVKHNVNGKVVDYCPCDELRTLGLTLIALTGGKDDAKKK